LRAFGPSFSTNSRTSVRKEASSGVSLKSMRYPDQMVGMGRL
jgi:hypothetical protein